MEEQMSEKITFLTTREMKSKIEFAAKISDQTSSDIIRQSIDLFFEKQEEKEISKAMLLRLEEIKYTMKENFENLDIIITRSNSFLNFYAENKLDSEDYKKLRANVVEEIDSFIKIKEYKK